MANDDGTLASDLQDRGFYNVHDGLKGRDGGPYLDHVIRQQSELNRALVEGREPADLNGPLPADAGTPLVVAALVVDNSLTSNPSMALRPGFAAVLDDASFNDKRGGSPQDDADKVSIADPISTLPVDVASDNSNNAGDDGTEDNTSDDSFPFTS